MKLTPFQWSSFSFFGYFCGYGVLLPFLPLWLNLHGYSTEMIGVLAALGFLFRFMGGMLFSQRIRHPNELISMIRKLAWVSVVMSGLIAWAVGSIWWLLPVFALFHLCNGGAMPINETIAATWQKQVGIDYGKTRLFGSIAFVVGSISTGYLVSLFGESAIIWIMTSWLFFLALGQLLPPSVGFTQENSQARPPQVSYRELLQDRTTLRMIAAAALIQMSHAAYYSYSTLHWTAQGISAQTASLLWGTAVVAEVCLFFIAKRAFKHHKTHHLMVASALLTSLRWFILGSTTNVALLALEQTFHAFSFGLTHYTMIRFISSQSTEKMAKLQGLYFAIGSCALMAIATLGSGVLFKYSPEWTFLLMVVISLPAAFIAPRQFPTRVSTGG